MSGAELARPFELLLRIDMGIDIFASRWDYCDRLSSYMARMIAHNRNDSLRYANLFSSALNELLETVFRIHATQGAFVCSILRRGAEDRIELCIPCDAEQMRFYREAVDRLKCADIEHRYRAALFAEAPLAPDVGLMELAVDYAADLFVETLAPGQLRVTANLSLEEP